MRASRAKGGIARITFPFCIDKKLMATSVVGGIFLHATANIVADVTNFSTATNFGL